MFQLVLDVLIVGAVGYGFLSAIFWFYAKLKPVEKKSCSGQCKHENKK